VSSHHSQQSLKILGLTVPDSRFQTVSHATFIDHLWNHSEILYLTKYAMTEESSAKASGSFSSFWHHSVDKVSSKSLKFMPNVTKPGNGNYDSSSN